MPGSKKGVLNKVQQVDKTEKEPFDKLSSVLQEKIRNRVAGMLVDAQELAVVMELFR